MSEISRVLLVGEDTSLRDRISQVILQIDSNTKVSTAENPQQAAAILQEAGEESPFKLVILDLDVKSPLAGVDLWSSCRNEYYDTEFLMISGLPMYDFLRLVEAAGGIPAHLPKPFQLDQCRSFISSFLTGNFELAA